MLDVLATVFDDGGKLAGVSSFNVVFDDGSPTLLTAYAFELEHITAVFRAMPEYDTLSASIGPLVPEADEIVKNVSQEQPWSKCIGLGLPWAWRLTNQQGYTDGVRFEFGKPDMPESVIVELVVMGSGIQVFGVNRLTP